jgi:hypothetical protein
VLGVHADDLLNVYIRNGDQLHQAARIVTVNGTDPAAMSSVMADLADTFGWRNIRVDEPVEVELAKAPERALPAPRVPASRKPRRRNEDMERQRQTVLHIVENIPESEAVAVPAIAMQVKRMLHFKGSPPSTSVRGQLVDLHAEGRVGRIDYQHPNGSRGSRWYGLAKPPPVG